MWRSSPTPDHDAVTASSWLSGKLLASIGGVAQLLMCDGGEVGRSRNLHRMEVTRRGRGDDTACGEGVMATGTCAEPRRKYRPGLEISGSDSNRRLFGFSDTATRAAHAITASEFTLERASQLAAGTRDGEFDACSLMVDGERLHTRRARRTGARRGAVHFILGDLRQATPLRLSRMVADTTSKSGELDRPAQASRGFRMSQRARRCFAQSSLSLMQAHPERLTRQRYCSRRISISLSQRTWRGPVLMSLPEISSRSP